MLNAGRFVLRVSRCPRASFTFRAFCAATLLAGNGAVVYAADASPPAATPASPVPTATPAAAPANTTVAPIPASAEGPAGGSPVPNTISQLGGGRGGRGGRGSGVTPEMTTAALAATPAIPAGPYQPTWDSVSAHQIPQWFVDAKFGISMHWGLYSVPAHGSEWYFQHMYDDAATREWHTEHYGSPDKFGYKDFIPLFTASKWDPDAWAALFKKSGAKYVMPSAEHHDGFALWDSQANKYNAFNMGPHRDLIGDLAAAVRKQGLKFGVTNHSMEHFNFVTDPGPDVPNDLHDPQWADFYSVADRSPAAHQKFLTQWVLQNYELIDKYKLDILWWDNGVNGREYDPLKLAVFAYFYNRAAQWGKDVTMDTKGNASLGGAVEDYERQSRAPTTIQTEEFEVHDSPGYRWGYLDNDTYQGLGWMIGRLVENVSKNGNFLFNIGPKADGTIPDEEVNLLLGMGEWLDVNGDAIYATRAWTTFGEGPNIEGRNRYSAQDIRFTTKGDTLYAIVMGWPDSGQVTIASLATGASSPGKVAKVEMLGHDGALDFTQDATGLTVKFPADKPCDIAYALKITGLKLK
jgi:alpha-L-fucosidase